MLQVVEDWRVTYIRHEYYVDIGVSLFVIIADEIVHDGGLQLQSAH